MATVGTARLYRNFSQFAGFIHKKLSQRPFLTNMFCCGSHARILCSIHPGIFSRHRPFPVQPSAEQFSVILNGSGLNECVGRCLGQDVSRRVPADKQSGDQVTRQRLQEIDHARQHQMVRRRYGRHAARSAFPHIIAVNIAETDSRKFDGWWDGVTVTAIKRWDVSFKIHTLDVSGWARSGMDRPIY